MDGTGAIWSTNVIKVRRFLNVKLENRFLEEVVAKKRSPLEEGEAGIISQTRRGRLGKVQANGWVVRRRRFMQEEGVHRRS